MRREVHHRPDRLRRPQEPRDARATCSSGHGACPADRQRLSADGRRRAILPQADDPRRRHQRFSCSQIASGTRRRPTTAQRGSRNSPPSSSRFSAGWVRRRISRRRAQDRRRPANPRHRSDVRARRLEAIRPRDSVSGPGRVLLLRPGRRRPAWPIRRASNRRTKHRSRRASRRTTSRSATASASTSTTPSSRPARC